MFIKVFLPQLKNLVTELIADRLLLFKFSLQAINLCDITLADDDADSLHARIQVQEHRLLPRVIHQIAIGAIALDPLRVNAPDGDGTRSLTAPDV
jgi:hypothetical protein